MGLDMFAFSSNSGKIKKSVDFKEPGDSKEIFYWRKHPNLHGWMENLYREKGGNEDIFNSVNLQLTSEDLDQLEKDIKRNKLPYTEGFFFGADENSEEEKREDLEFIEKARKEISEGKMVYYTSWW